MGTKKVTLVALGLELSVDFSCITAICKDIVSILTVLNGQADATSPGDFGSVTVRMGLEIPILTCARPDLEGYCPRRTWRADWD